MADVTDKEPTQENPAESTDSDSPEVDSPGDTEKPKTDWKALYLTSKDKIERVNEVEKELAEMRERQSQPPAQPQAHGADHQLAVIRKDIQTLQFLASTEPEDSAAGAIARTQLRSAQYMEQELRRVQGESQIAALPDDEREGVRKLLYTGDYATVQAARKAFKGETLEKRLRESEEQSKRLSSEAAAKKSVGQTQTITRGIPAQEIKGKMLRSVWINEWDQAKASGDQAKLKELRAQEGNLLPG